MNEFYVLLGNYFRKKKETVLKDAIKSGHRDDIDYLIVCIDKFNAGLDSHSFHNFLVAVSSCKIEGDENKQRFSKWLHNIGFKENNFGTLYYPSDEVLLIIIVLGVC